MRKKEKQSLAHERRIKKELQLHERKITHYQTEMRSQEHRFKLGLQKEKNREEVQRRHARNLIGMLTRKLNKEKEGTRKLGKEKHVFLHVRSRLLTWLKIEKGRRSKQLQNMEILKRELHDAVMKERSVERELKKQMQVTKHLKALFGCGKWQILANHEKKHSWLLKREGIILSRLAHELYHVERKVRDLTKMLKRHAYRTRTQAVRRKKELERAERYVKWAHRMIREEKSHKW